MSLIVQKFGGTSVQNVERIKHVAGIVKAEIERVIGLLLLCQLWQVLQIA